MNAKLIAAIRRLDLEEAFDLVASGYQLCYDDLMAMTMYEVAIVVEMQHYMPSTAYLTPVEEAMVLTAKQIRDIPQQFDGPPDDGSKLAIHTDATQQQQQQHKSSKRPRQLTA